MAKVPEGESNFDLSEPINRLNLEEDDSDQLIIAIDFGTTFSGVAYTFTGQGTAEPRLVNEWPGTEGETRQKTPTLMDYASNDRRSFVWGSKVNPISKTKLEGIKLLLDPDQTKPLYVPAGNTRKELQRLGKPAVDVASDYLGVLYNHALEQICKSSLDGYVEMHQKRFILTVPAVWSDKAKDITLKARSLYDFLPDL
jgi:molecular chaperone DnaK (HSP70)